MTNRARPANTPPSSALETFVLGVVGAVVAAGAVLWLGAQAASLVRNRHPLDLDAEAVALALRHLPATMGNPRLAFAQPFRGQLPGPIVFWPCLLLALGVAGSFAYGLWRVFRSERTPLDRRTRLGVGAEARLATARDLKPLMVGRPRPGRFVLGRFRRHLLAAENPAAASRRRRWRGDIGSIALIGPSRSGKTRCAQAGIRHWRQPAILSSVKTDLLASTVEDRRRLGEVKVFDPTGVTGMTSAHWTPLRAAGSLQGAAATAKALVDAAPRGERSSDSHWLKQAEILLTSLLWLAANSEKRTISDVVDWVLGLDRPTDDSSGTVGPLLRAHVESADKALSASAVRVHRWMKGLWELDPRTSSSVYATAPTAIWPWADPDVAAVSEGCDIDLDWLLRETNTLYHATPLADQDRLAPVLGGLIADLVNQAFERVSRVRRRLDPTLLLVLDEAANTPVRKLPEWASTVAGIGIQLVTVWQSKSQLEAIYGAQADTILTNHLTKLFFTGMSDAAGLEYVGRLSGYEHVPGYLGSDKPDAAGRVTPTQVALLAPNVVRQIRPGDALLVHGTLPPAHVRPSKA
ncbi:MAG: type IV secretory system conjugative DNA transfer family protein [Actinomycetota bacterium]|nr:type IV secretory system conjugative DNA transfer family protein [Actinomycetota bacterium]